MSVDADRPRDPAGGRSDPVAGAHVPERFRGDLEAQATRGRWGAPRERQGLPTPHGGRHGNRSTVRWLVRHPVSVGDGEAGRPRTSPAGRRRSALQPVGQRGARRELADRQAWLLVTTIPAMGSPDVFDRVQVKLAENRRRARRHTTTGESRLRALVSGGVGAVGAVGGDAGTGRQEKPRSASSLSVCRQGRRRIGRSPAAAIARGALPGTRPPGACPR